MWRIRQGAWWPLLVVALSLVVGCGGEPAREVATIPESTGLIASGSTQEAVVPAATEESPTAVATPTPPAPLAATVNGQYIFLADYERRVGQYEEALYDQGFNPNTAEGQEAFRVARSVVLEGLIDTALIQQEANALGLGLTEEELESEVVASIEEGGGQAAFDEWLQVTGQTREEYREMLREALIVQKVQEAVTAQVESEMEQVHVRRILVDSEQAALDILTLLQEGAEFAELARERSLDPITKDNGGDLGWFPRGVVSVELENAAFSLQPGQMSGVIQDAAGFQIIQLVERAAAYPLSLDMQLGLKSVLFEEWLAEKRDSATIERFVGE